MKGCWFPVLTTSRQPDCASQPGVSLSFTFTLTFTLNPTCTLLISNIVMLLIYLA